MRWKGVPGDTMRQGEAAERAGRRGCPMNTVQPETQETGEGARHA